MIENTFCVFSVQKKGDFMLDGKSFVWSYSSNTLICSLMFCRTNIQQGKVDIGQLTWEQKECVLRLLFARMNGLERR